MYIDNKNVKVELLGLIRIPVGFRRTNPDPVSLGFRIRVFLKGRIRTLVNFSRIHNPADNSNDFHIFWQSSAVMVIPCRGSGSYRRISMKKKKWTDRPLRYFVVYFCYNLCHSYHIWLWRNKISLRWSSYNLCYGTVQVQHV